MMCKLSPKVALVAIASLFSLVESSANATTILPSTAQGIYGSTGGASSPLDNPIQTGESGTASIVNYFTFDLSSLAGQVVTSGILYIDTPNGIYGGGDNPDTQETYRVFDYSGSPVTLVLGLGGIAAFTDLSTGNSYGHADIDVSDGSIIGPVSIQLTSAALSDINTALSVSLIDFVIGGDCTTCTENQTLWAFTTFAPAAELRLEVALVPLPAALPLYGTGLGLMGLVGWWRRRRPAAT
jgi:hypothetical protein